jgi:protein associated with RNAse G/E
VMWLAGTPQVRCWYVHLQEPLRRTKIGFDTMDQMLDLVISPDKSHWHWKDEDEFQEAGAIRLYSVEKISAIRAEGEKVIQMLGDNASPFFDGWENWRPPTDWTIPTFPPGWEEYPL